MHSAVLQNKRYIRYAARNTVEVMTLGSIERGVQQNDRRAATYKVRGESGDEIEYLVEFPGLRVEDIVAMNRSPAVRYNDTRAIPHTAFVDPFSLEKLAGIRGGVSSRQVMRAADEAREVIRKKHGAPSISRRDLARTEEIRERILRAIAMNRLSQALSELRRLRTHAGDWPEEARIRVAEVERIVIEPATKALDELEAKIEESPQRARVELLGLAIRLRGTELEARAQALLARAKERAK